MIDLNNHKLLEIINDLQQIIDNLKDNLITKKVKDAIFKFVYKF